MRTAQYRRVSDDLWVWEFEGQIVSAIAHNWKGPDHVVWSPTSLEEIYQAVADEIKENDLK